MSYTKQTHTDGDILTAVAMNHIEDGIADVDTRLSEAETTSTEHTEQISEIQTNATNESARISDLETAIETRACKNELLALAVEVDRFADIKSYVDEQIAELAALLAESVSVNDNGNGMTINNAG